MAKPVEAPSCPYCGAAWTAAMLDALDRHSHSRSCTCCVVLPGLGFAAIPVPTPTPTPKQDLCCESCGKPVYNAPGASGSGGLH